MQISGTAIRDARAAAGLSQTQLAAAVDVSVDTIRRAENGSHSPRASTVVAIARTLGVSMESLFASDEPAVA